MTYLLPQSAIDLSADRLWYKGQGQVARKRPGYIPLFDRNLQKFIWFHIIRKSMTHFAYIVERNKPPTMYWRAIVLPVEASHA